MKLSDMKYLACEIPDSVRAFHESGWYDREIRTIDTILAKPTTPDVMKKRLGIQKIVAESMKYEYPLDFAEALQQIREDIPDFSAEDLESVICDSAVDWHMKNGEPHFQDYFMISLYDIRPDLIARRKEPLPSPSADYRNENDDIMKNNGKRAFRYRIRCSIQPKDGMISDGEKIYVHLPFPVPCAEQTDIVVHGMSANGVISGDQQRTVHFSTEYHTGDAYYVDYSYTMTAPYLRFSPDEVSAEQPDFYTDEKLPQIVFTPYLRMLATEIVGNEQNPLRKARLVYDFVCKQLHYSYVREYLNLCNIPEGCLLNFYGDCGVMALAFITLCRILGIPARWQSGFSVRPGHLGPHDWAQFYVAPFGWLWCDPSYGSGAYHNGNVQVYEHYFGNLDPFRMISCTDVMEEFDPPKMHQRTDPYDNQNGEIECIDRGLDVYSLEVDRELLEAREI